MRQKLDEQNAESKQVCTQLELTQQQLVSEQNATEFFKTFNLDTDQWVALKELFEAGKIELPDDGDVFEMSHDNNQMMSDSQEEEKKEERMAESSDISLGQVNDSMFAHSS